MHTFNIALFWAELPMVGGMTIVFAVVTSIVMIPIHWYGHVGRGLLAGLVSSAVFGVISVAAVPILAPFFYVFYRLQKWSEPQED